jgi:hypothetical protein
MSRTAAKVTQADIARVLRAIAAAKAQMRVRVTADGEIIIEPCPQQSVDDSPKPPLAATREFRL